MVSAMNDTGEGQGQALPWEPPIREWTAAGAERQEKRPGPEQQQDGPDAGHGVRDAAAPADAEGAATGNGAEEDIPPSDGGVAVPRDPHDDAPGHEPVPGVIFLGAPGEPLRPAFSATEATRRLPGDGPSGRAPVLAGGAGIPSRRPARLRGVVAVLAILVVGFIVTRAAVAAGDLGQTAGSGPSPSPSALQDSGASVTGPGLPSGDAGQGAGAVQSETPASPPSAVASPTASEAAGLPAEPVDWLAVMVELDQLRSKALAAVDTDAVAAYAPAGTPANEADVRTVEALAAAGARPVGFRTRIVGVEVLASAKGSARLRVVDERGAYRLEDSVGAVVEEVAAAGRRSWIVSVEWRAAGRACRDQPQCADVGGWRVVRVEAS